MQEQRIAMIYSEFQDKPLALYLFTEDKPIWSSSLTRLSLVTDISTAPLFIDKLVCMFLKQVIDKDNRSHRL